MSEGAVGLLVLGAMALAAALLCHARIERFALGCGVSALLVATVFVVADALRAGHVDPFLPIAWLGAALLALVVSAAVGLARRALRARGPSSARGGPPP